MSNPSHDDDDDDTYIVLELQPATTISDKLDQYDKEFEFCILVPKFVPFPGFPPSPSITSSPDNGFSSKTSWFGNGGELAEAQPRPANHTTPLIRIFRNVVPRRSLSRPSDAGDDDDDDDYDGYEINNSKSCDRKEITNGIIDLLKSIIISMQTQSTEGGSNRPSHRSWRIGDLMKPIDKLFTKSPKLDLQLMMMERSNGCRVPEKSTTFKVLFEDLNLVDAMRKLFVTGGRRNNTVVQSCPISIKSSPVHQYADTSDSSISAAIAHCKKSLGQADDFSF